MSFTFNDLNGSKSNATAVRSTNSPSKSNLNTDDSAKKTGDKTSLNIDSIASGSKSESNSSLFVFGNISQEKNSDLKTSEGFNFVFNSNSFDTSSSKSNTESKVVSSTDMGVNSNNNLFDIKEGMEPKLEDKAGAVFDSDNNNGNSSDTSNENSVKDEQVNNKEQKQDENSNEEVTVVKTLVKEFKDVISSFVKERIEGERKIAALESRIHTLEEEVQNLKSANSKESSSASVTNTNDAAKPVANSVPQQQAQQSLEPPTPALTSRQLPSPLVPSLPESSTLKKTMFGSTSSLFGTGSGSLMFNGTSNLFGSTSSSLGNDTTVPSNTAVGTSMFNSSVSTQTQTGSQLFGASTQTLNQSNKNFAQELKQVGNPKKLFTNEAVTSFLNAQKDPSMNNNLTRVNSGNPLKKMATGQECSEQNQNISTKEAFQANLQRTIESSVKKFMEEYWKNFSSNASEDNFQKFNGNLF